MTVFLDTSVVVRYITGDPPDQAEKALAIIESDRPLVVATVGLAEIAFVLTSNYRVPRSRVVDAMIALLERPNVAVHDLTNSAAIEALSLCRPSRRVSFADALIWAAARTTLERRVITFDQRFPSRDLDLELLV